MKLAIVGSRGYKNLENVGILIYNLDHDIEVVSGGADGVDNRAATRSRQLGMQVKTFLPDWTTHGKSAGPLRNTAIVKYSDNLVAFHDGSSKGTSDSMRKAKEQGKLFYTFEDRPYNVEDLIKVANELNDIHKNHSATVKTS